MEEDIVLQVGIPEQLVDLLKGLQYIFIGIPSFPNLNQLSYRSRYIPLCHGREERQKVEVEGCGAEHAHKRERERLFLMNVDVSDKRKKAKKIAQISRRQTHHPRPHLVGELLGSGRGHFHVAEQGGALLHHVHRVHPHVDTTGAQGGNEVLLRGPDKEEARNVRVRLHGATEGLL
jgi:hypothetical protein